MFPLNASQTPSLSPPTPPTNVSPNEGGGGYPSSSFSHPSAPPPLSALPARHSSENTNQIIVTPNEIAAHQQMAQNVSPPLEEPLVIDPMLSAIDSQREGDESDGYFEGVVGLKQDGTALIDKNMSATSPYPRWPNSPSNSNNLHHHPYRRPSTMTSPNRVNGNGQNSSPTMQFNPSMMNRTYSNNGNGRAADGKPVFAMPFTPQLNGGYALQHQDGMLAPPLESVKMEKQASADGDPVNWQRWSVIHL